MSGLYVWKEHLGLIKTFTRPWFVCGGWALDLFIGKQTREHHDLDIGIFRRDQLALQGFFANQTL